MLLILIFKLAMALPSFVTIKFHNIVHRATMVFYFKNNKYRGVYLTLQQRINAFPFGRQVTIENKCFVVKESTGGSTQP